MLTYNHARYVERAVASVLSQRTPFPVELVIAEDLSPDGTRETVLRLERAHPDIVRVLPRSRNLGLQANLRRAWTDCRGQYVALLEGDDYWTHDGKLAEQVAFMDAHPAMSLSAHQALLVGPSDEPLGIIPPATPSELSFSTLLRTNYLPTCSVMVRGGVVPRIPDWFAELELADWPLFLLHAERGSVGFLPVRWAAYRRHHGGVWSALATEEQVAATIAACEALDAHFRFRHHALIRQTISAHLTVAVSARLAVGDVRGARRYFLRALHASRSRRDVRTAAMVYAPRLHAGQRAVRARLRAIFSAAAGNEVVDSRGEAVVPDDAPRQRDSNA